MHCMRAFRLREPLYTTYQGMISRCYSKNNVAYHRYGGRGIGVCREWKGHFQRFKADMGSKPSPLHSLDRIDNDKGYSPDNCRWATQTEQHMNRGIFSRNTSGVQGVSRSPKSAKLPWRAYVTKNKKQIHLGYFKTFQEAVMARKNGAEKHYGMQSNH